MKEAPVPKLKSNEVLVKVHAVSLQYRDLIVAKGQYPLTQKDNLVPGSDLAGELIAVGEDVKGWKFGERVFATDHIYGDPTEEIEDTSLGGPIDGVLTEYKILPAHVSASHQHLCVSTADTTVCQALVRIPEHLTYEEGATLPAAALTAYNALMGAVPLKGGNIVLVQGTGGVSIFGLQLAVASGATVIATSSSNAKLEIAKKLGAAHLINYNETPDWDKEVLELTGGRGVDHVLEIGGPGTIVKSVNATRYGGQINVIGFVAGVRTNHAHHGSYICRFWG